MSLHYGQYVRAQFIITVSDGANYAVVTNIHFCLHLSIVVGTQGVDINVGQAYAISWGIRWLELFIGRIIISGGEVQLRLALQFCNLLL